MGVAPLVALGGAVATAAPAHADEVYPRPADGIIDLRGHGWGHGNGMSQYGAYGGALAGKTWQQIVGYYYTGITIGSIGNPTIRVRVKSVGSTVQALPASGLQVSYNGSSFTTLPTSLGGKSIARWRLTGLINPTPGQVNRIILQYLPTGSGARWTTRETGPAQLGMFRNPTGAGTVTILRGTTQVVYRGQVRAALIGPTGQETMVPIVALPMESYLRSVVPSEMPASWPQSAVSSQAVAARSFAEHHRRYAPVSRDWYDVYDDTRSQVFNGTKVGGTTYEHPSSDTAIQATANQAVFYGSTVAFTQFSSSSGGWTATGSQPYLRAKADPWDAVSANPNHTWAARVAVSSVERAYPAIGTYQRMRITERSGGGYEGGRVERLVLEGSSGTASITGNTMRAVFGLKSNWFVPTDGSAPSYPRDVTRDGRADVLAVVESTGALRVYRGSGTGSWGAMNVAEASGWTNYAKALTAGTWDADSISDVIVQTPSGHLQLRSGRGDGTFATGVAIGAGWDMHNLVLPVGDFSGDGYTDLLARRASDGALWLYRGNGDGAFKGYGVVGTGWGGFTAIFSPGDFNGDGESDVLARTAGGTLYLYPGNGEGGWKPRIKVGSGWQGFRDISSPGDFDGDRRADVLARASDGTLYLYPGSGTGGWKPRRAVGSGWQIFASVLL